MSELAYLLHFVRPYSARIAVSVVLMAIVGACHGAVALLIEPVLGRVLEPESTSGPILLYKLPFLDTALYLDDLVPFGGDVWLTVSVGIVGVFILKGICDFTGNYLVNYVGLAGVRDLRNEVYSVVLNQSPAFFQKQHTGKIISSLVPDIDRIQVAFSHILADLLRQSSIAIFLLWVVIQTDWRLALFALTVLPAVLIPTSRIGRRIRSTTRKAQDDLGELTQILEETISGNRVVKAFGMERFEIGRFRTTADRLLQSSLKYVRQQAITSPMIEIFAALTIVGLLTYARSRIQTGQLNMEQFVTFVVALLMLYQPVKRLNGIYNIFQQALGAAQRVMEYVEHPHDVAEQPDAHVLEPFRREIVFDDVSFHYPETESEALSELSFRVSAGEVVAIVGPSGAGKSTLMNLLPRFFDPSAGAIRIDGQDIRGLKLDSLREQIAIVTQETFLFADSVRNNVAYGRPDVPETRLRAATDSALASKFIDELPEAYETHLGERGHRLSGGQRQRLAIARALLKDTPILLLDEATAHLDSESELLVQRALANLMEGRTVLVSAHRLSTVRSADRILVMDGGRLVDQGRHEELLVRCPLYRRLSELQSVGT